MNAIAVRTIVRTALFFDGTTVETVTGYSPPTSESFLRAYKADVEHPVGRFSSVLLSNPDNKRPMVVSWRLIGTPVPGESRVEIRSAASGDAEAAYAPVDKLLSSHLLTTTWSGWQVLGPTDRLWVFHEDEEASTMEFRVLEFAQAMLLGLTEALAEPAAESNYSIVAFNSLTLTASQVNSGTGFSTVTMTGAVGQQLALPPIADVNLGAAIAVFNSSANAHQFACDGTDLINNLAGPLADAAGQQTLIVAMGSSVGVRTWVTFVGA